MDIVVQPQRQNKTQEYDCPYQGGKVKITSQDRIYYAPKANVDDDYSESKADLINTFKTVTYTKSLKHMTISHYAQFAIDGNTVTVWVRDIYQGNPDYPNATPVQNVREKFFVPYHIGEVAYNEMLVYFDNIRAEEQRKSIETEREKAIIKGKTLGQILKKSVEIAHDNEYDIVYTPKDLVYIYCAVVFGWHIPKRCLGHKHWETTPQPRCNNALFSNFYLAECKDKSSIYNICFNDQCIGSCLIDDSIEVELKNTYYYSIDKSNFISLDINLF